MDGVYILYSPKLNKFYTGSSKDVTERITQHLNEYFPGAFTSIVKDWILYYQLDNLTSIQARKIEKHIKRMKSRKYIENLKEYPEIGARLVNLYK